MFQKMMWLSLAGACGTVSRYSIYELAAKTKGCPIPLGTLGVNIIGSFLFGLIYVLVGRKIAMNSDMKLIMLTGFVGAFSTFSTFAFETAKMLKSAQWTLAAGNILSQTVFGILALAAGALLARMI